MANHTLSDISKAADDQNLRDRLISAAAEAGIPNPHQWVDTNARQLASAPISEGNVTDSIASVYAYAVTNRTPPAGADPAAVTDAYLRHAVQEVLGN